MSVIFLLEKISSLVWGTGLLFLLLFTGLFFTFRLKFIQFGLFTFLFRQIKRKDNSSAQNGFSQLKTVCVSLGTAMGTGNIVGVSAALIAGGAGSIFWMWVSAFLGMALVYSENYLSVLFKEKDSCFSGPMCYIEKGLGSRRLAMVFSVFCLLASFGMGGMVQSNSISIACCNCFNISPIYIALIIFTAVIAVTLGGMKRIGTVAGIIIPFITSVYIAASIAVIIIFRENLFSAFKDIFSQAFSFKSAAGGVGGYTMSKALSVGLRRGIFSNEAGLGSSPIMHGTAENTSPSVQGMWSVFEVFLDTIICCTLTALVLLTSKAENFSINKAFSVIFGSYSDIFIFISITLFAFCTIIGWYYCGETAFRFITNGKATKAYSIVFSAVTAFGAISALEAVWTLSDIFNGLMAFPNLLALILLSFRVKNTYSE